MIKDILRYLYFRSPIRIPYLIVFVTSRCNFRCPNCFYLDNLGRGANDMTLDEFKRVTPGLGRLLWLSFSGGEPSLRDDLPELAVNFYENTRFKRFNIPTNGFLSERITSMIAEMLPHIPADFSVTVSVDGINELHDELRGTPGSFEALSKTIHKLKELKRAHPHLSVKVSTVISNRNSARISEIAEYVRAKFAPDFHAFELVRAQPPESPIQPPLLEECEEIYRLVRANWAHYGQYESNQGPMTNFLAKGLYKYLHRVHLASLREARQAIPCLAGRVSAVIYEDGRTALCELLPTIGNLRETGYDINMLLKSKAAQEQLAMIKRGGCHCTHTCFQFTSVLFNPRLYPRILLHSCRS